jgi:FkbM family methyltransferase
MLLKSKQKITLLESKIAKLREECKKVKNQRDLARERLSNSIPLSQATVAPLRVDFALTQIDTEIISSLAAREKLTTRSGLVTDFTGCVISPEHYPSIEPLCGKILGLPVPTDGMLHHALEYLGLGLAIKLAEEIDPSRDSFHMAELGAGNGIWSARTARCCLAAGFKRIHLVCVEADNGKFHTIEEHLKLNGLWDHPSIQVHLENAPVTSDGRNIFFPKQRSSTDYGLAMTDTNKETDYRGHSTETEERRSVSLVSMLEEHTVWDLLNIDIQGAELDLITSCSKLIREKVRVLVVGTHSRHIEGCLIEALYPQGLYLHSEKPCVFRYIGNEDNLVGRTSEDGEQVWVNPHLV